MRIGIIVFSRAGHTLSVARQLEAKLMATEHEVVLEQIKTAGPESLSATSAVLAVAPAFDGFEGLVFACPVQGGLPAVPMQSYLDRIPSLLGKKVALLVTGAFPARWGRNQALARLGEIVKSKGATVCGSASVGWISLRRKREIAEAVDSLSALF